MERNGDETQDQPDYLSYLLRLWRVTIAGQIVWRGSLECPHTGERLGFAGPDSLWDFLQTQMQCGSGEPRDRVGEGR